MDVSLYFMEIDFCNFRIDYILSYYNGFIKKSNRVKERESQIDVLLNQRFDLIPNIVNCVKGYAKHEKTTLENITKLRSDYQNNGFR